METKQVQRANEEHSLNPKECLLGLFEQLDDTNLRQVLNIELKRLVHGHDRLVNMLQQQSEHLENENEDLKTALDTMHQRHEKAVREMQFYKKKYEKIANDVSTNGGVPPTPTTTISSSHRSISNMSTISYGSELSTDALYHHGPPPPSPMHSQHLRQQQRIDSTILEDYDPDLADYSLHKSSNMATRSVSSSYAPHWSTPLTDVSECPQPAKLGRHNDDMPPTGLVRTRQNSSASTYSDSIYSTSNVSTKSYTEKQLKHQSNASLGSKSSSSWQYLRHPSHSTPPSSASSTTGSATIQTAPMTPVRSSTTTSGYTGHSLIQQRRVDPLIFGGADGLWDTIAKSKGSDVTVEKIISNFLRRGGSPNTAKQQSSSSSHVVKSGYGLIHALIVTKAPGSLDLLLQQGANPNAMTLSTVDEDKCSPCYLAAKVGWLAGLQKLVQAGGNLVTCRGGGSKNKTILHVAAEHCHAAVVEYVVQMTRGELNNQVDTHGATVLHYACASGHTDLVSLLARACQVPVLQADYQGELPLHWAVRQGRLEVVTLMIERFGVDCNAYVPKKVGTPLDLAKSAGHKRLVDYLKGLGALTSKKMDKRREEELSKKVPGHFEFTLAKHGLFSDLDDF
ncbi:ankyrin repeat-containing domain protein [Chlamydoabsidia padenii]|nr:ankyrin repeat-containing domain protein [Chlamydoabsidia padenii]